MTTGDRGDPAERKREPSAAARAFAERVAGDLPPPLTDLKGKLLPVPAVERFAFPNFFGALSEAFAEIEEHKGKLGMLTGWRTIDLALGRPIVRKELLVFAARANVGKSWAAQLFLEHQLKLDQDLVALFLSLEMSRTQLAERVAVHAMGGTPAEVRSAMETHPDMVVKNIQQDFPELERLYLADISCKLEEIPLAVHVTEQRCGRKVGLVAVDYLGLLGSEATRGQRLYESVSYVARSLKGLANELDLVILLAAQLNREGGGAGDTEPDISALRDSGAIEEAADRVFLMWQLLPAEKGEPPGRYLKVKLGKNRHGAKTQGVQLLFDQSMRLLLDEGEYIAPQRSVFGDDLPY